MSDLNEKELSFKGALANLIGCLCIIVSKQTTAVGFRCVVKWTRGLYALIKLQTQTILDKTR